MPALEADAEARAVHAFVAAVATTAKSTVKDGRFDAEDWSRKARTRAEDALARDAPDKAAALRAKADMFDIAAQGLADILEAAGLHDAANMSRALQAVHHSLFDQWDALVRAKHEGTPPVRPQEPPQEPEPEPEPEPPKPQPQPRLRTVLVEQPRIVRHTPDDGGDDDDGPAHARAQPRPKNHGDGDGDALPTGDPRDLTLRQTREIILAVCTAKVRANRRAALAHVPQETMAHFLITWLNHRFGLRSLVRRWAVTIVSNVKAYAGADFAVASFQHVVRNEVDEGVVRDQRRLHRQLVSSFAGILRRARDTRGDGDFGGASAAGGAGASVGAAGGLQDLRAGNAQHDDATLVSTRRHIQRAEWEEVLHELLDDADANRVSSALASHCTSGLLPFEQFVQATLSDFLTRRRQYLAPVTEAFRRVDTSGRGIVNHAGFRAFLAAMHADYGVDMGGGSEGASSPGSSSASLSRLVASVDPRGVGSVTFSQAASLFVPVGGASSSPRR